jgi:ISXO2 transposase-like protein
MRRTAPSARKKNASSFRAPLPRSSRIFASCKATLALETFINETVATDVSLLATDKHRGYQDLKRIGFKHGTADHSRKQYVVGAIHTNTIEGFWSLVKRGVIGTYHKVSKKYLPLKIAEFQFRYNNRLNDDISGEAIRRC